MENVFLNVMKDNKELKECNKELKECLFKVSHPNYFWTACYWCRSNGSLGGFTSGARKSQRKTI